MSPACSECPHDDIDPTCEQGCLTCGQPAHLVIEDHAGTIVKLRARLNEANKSLHASVAKLREELETRKERYRTSAERYAEECEELDRIRALVGAGEGESTVDAVARLAKVMHALIPPAHPEARQEKSSGR